MKNLSVFLFCRIGEESGQEDSGPVSIFHHCGTVKTTARKEELRAKIFLFLLLFAFASFFPFFSGDKDSEFFFSFFKIDFLLLLLSLSLSSRNLGFSTASINT